jgi:hypothetical protein
LDFFSEGDILVRLEKSIEIKATPQKAWEMLAFDNARMDK